MKIKTDYEHCDYIVPGKVYDVIGFSGMDKELPVIIGENGGEVWTMPNGHPCAHLDWLGVWEVVE